VEEGGEAAGADEVVDEELLLLAIEVSAEAGQVVVAKGAERGRLVLELALRQGHLAEPLDCEDGLAAVERGAVRRAEGALGEHLGRRPQQRLQVVRPLRRAPQEHQLLALADHRRRDRRGVRLLHGVPVRPRHGYCYGRGTPLHVCRRTGGPPGRRRPTSAEAGDEPHDEQENERGADDDADDCPAR
jgi:hypothetical protein